MGSARPGRDIPQPSPTSRQLLGSLLPQQNPRPHKNLTQLLVLRSEVKACKSARWFGEAGGAKDDPRVGVSLLSQGSAACFPKVRSAGV